MNPQRDHEDVATDSANVGPVSEHGVPRGVAGAITVRDMACDGDGPWRLFVGTYGVAQWPSESAYDDPEGYAKEVARCVRDALADTAHGPVLADERLLSAVRAIAKLPQKFPYTEDEKRRLTLAVKECRAYLRSTSALNTEGT